MAYDYDKLYGSTSQALGEPTKIFVDFFEHNTTENLRVLDVGCGQGRDALFVARKGHRVVGIDLSPNGIRDLNEKANAENLDVEGIVADISTFDPEGEFDVVLIDRTLHMLPEKERLDVLARVISAVPIGGWVLIADEASNMRGLKRVFSASEREWKTKLEAGGTLFLQRS
jgi:2-polyprenyl-3-methyl-5-hydroxy-6-metoxy-1,4-benzoquinol methylase